MDIKEAVGIATFMKEMLDSKEALTPLGLRNRDALRTLIDYCSEPKERDICPSCINYCKGDWVMDTCPRYLAKEPPQDVNEVYPDCSKIIERPTKEVSQEKEKIKVYCDCIYQPCSIHTDPAKDELCPKCGLYTCLCPPTKEVSEPKVDDLIYQHKGGEDDGYGGKIKPVTWKEAYKEQEKYETWAMKEMKEACDKIKVHPEWKYGENAYPSPYERAIVAGCGQAVKQLQEELIKAKEVSEPKVEMLPKVNNEYQCEHVKEKIIRSSCVWCNLTVAEKIIDRLKREATDNKKVGLEEKAVEELLDNRSIDSCEDYYNQTNSIAQSICNHFKLSVPINRKRLKDLIEIATARGSVGDELSEVEIEYWERALSIYEEKPEPKDEKCPKEAKNDVDKLWQLVKIQVDDPSSKTDPYMRGMANGLICALAVFKKWEPIYINKPKEVPEPKVELEENKILDMLEGYELNIERSKTNSERRRYRLELAQRFSHFKLSVPSALEIHRVIADIGLDQDCEETDRIADAIHSLLLERSKI